MPLFHFTGENTKVEKRKSFLQGHYSAGKWQTWGLNQVVQLARSLCSYLYYYELSRSENSVTNCVFFCITNSKVSQLYFISNLPLYFKTLFKSCSGYFDRLLGNVISTFSFLIYYHTLINGLHPYL